MKTNEKASSLNRQDKAELSGWLVVIGLAAFFLVWGVFIFFTVGDKGPAAWHFGVVQDIPGESPYSDYGPKLVPGTGLAVPPQHVDGETTKPYGLKKEVP